MSIVLQGSTSGSVTLQEPAVAGTTVLDLPAVSGTILTTGSSGQSIPKAALPTGSVLQVVSTTYSTYTTNATDSYIDTGLSLSITPQFSTSKIFILVDQGGVYNNTNLSGVSVQLLRNSTNLGVFAVGYSYSLADLIVGVSLSYLDSPATTSSTTYKTQFKRFSSGVGTANVQANTNISTITLMEIAA
jgi:hypothetical protein